MPVRPTTLEDLIDVARRYVADNLPGEQAGSLRLDLLSGRKVAHPIPVTVPRRDCPEETPAAQTPPVRAAFGQGDEPQFRCDGEMVYWPGRGVFQLSPRQALVALALWRARQAGDPYVRGDKLLRESGSSAVKLSTLFQGANAWGALVLPYPNTPGAYCLPALPGEDLPGNLPPPARNLPDPETTV